MKKSLSALENVLLGQHRGGSRSQRGTQTFTVRKWCGDVDGPGSFTFGYQIDGELFTERLYLPDQARQGNVDHLDRVLNILAVVLGVSYFKAFAPLSVHYEGFALDERAQALVTCVYDHGMREFAWVNGFEIPFHTSFPPPAPSHVTHQRPVGDAIPGRMVIPFGGGKDSSLVASVLADRTPILFTIGPNTHASRTASALGVEIVFASRTLDPRIAESESNGYLNGHVPVTAINSLLSWIFAELIGADAVVMANERSASSETLPGVNHQYSKSLEFERALRGTLSPSSPDYFSALRPWGDLAVARAFATRPASHDSFMSCNRAFVRDPGRRSSRWCGNCDKCRSVFLSLAPFVRPVELESIFEQNLLDDPKAEGAFMRLVDGGSKPFECVADVSDARRAFWLLCESPEWRRFAIVRAMRSNGMITEPDGETFIASGEHFVPAELFSYLDDRVFTWPR